MKPPLWVLVALLVSGAVLVGVELGKGALDEPSPKIADPCQPRAGRTGGIDTTIQRIVLDGLDGAACRLHTTREELVLSFVPAAGTKEVRWDRKTIDEALNAGFDSVAAATMQPYALIRLPVSCTRTDSIRGTSCACQVRIFGQASCGSERAASLIPLP